MKTKYKFIYFERIPDKNGFYIKNNKLGAYLGVIGYYPPWRQYVFEGYEGCVFNNTCLSDIQHFIGQLERWEVDCG